MTREEREKALEVWYDITFDDKRFDEARKISIEALKAEPCEDAISRSDMLDAIGHGTTYTSEGLQRIIKGIPPVNPQEPKTGHCKECKWWKDKDGVYRRGIGAESKCPINRREVFEGNGYCYMFEPQETETWNGMHAQITAPKGTFERIFNDADDDNDI